MKILLVEDEKKIANLLEKALTKQKHLVRVVHDGHEAIEVVETEEFDIAILDVMLPRADGFEICEHIRKLGLKYPILMLTARDSLQDKVVGLDSGADDYLTKPFQFEELFARIRALSRREELIHEDVLTHRELKIDVLTSQATVSGKKLSLTRKEFLFLEFMLRHKGIVNSRTLIGEHLWGGDYLYTQQQNNMLNVLVSRLRKKIADLSDGKDYIETVNKQGYRLI